MTAGPVRGWALWTVAALCLGLAAATWVVYFQVKGFQFINYDDIPYITANAHTLQGLSWKNVIWAFTTGAVANWHPVTWLSHLADVSMFGTAPGGHHLTSVVIHTANAILLFLLLRAMTRDLWPSFLVAALFAVHPLHVESVAWVAERKDVLSMFFLLLTVGVYVRGPADRRFRFAALALYALGLMAKPMLVTLPLLLLFLDRWPLKRELPFRTLVWEKLPYAGLALASSAVTFVVQRAGGAVISMDRIPLLLRLGNALTSYLAYLGHMFWPLPLAPFYPFVLDDVTLWKSLLAAVLLAAITVLAVRTRHRMPYVLAGWLWYLATLLPVIGLVQVGSQSMADRYTYIPLVGPFIILAWGTRDAARLGRWTTWILVLGWTGALGLLTVQARRQTAYWRDSFTLFSHERRVAADNILGRNNLGQALVALGRVEEAIPEFRTAVSMNPRSRLARMNLGQALIRLGRQEEAVVVLRELPGDSEAMKTLADLLLAMGRLEEAIPCYQTCLQLEMGWAGEGPEQFRRMDRAQDLRMRLGLLHRKLGREAQAMPYFREASRQNPSNGIYLYNLGLSLAALDRNPEALACFRRWVALSPRQPQAHLQLGIALAKAGDPAGAEAEFRTALDLQPDEPEARSRLAAILAGRTALRGVRGSR